MGSIFARALLGVYVAVFATSARASWSTSSSFGVAREDRSTDGLTGAAGSLLSLGVAYRLKPSWAVGLSAIGSGSTQQDRSFLRLESLPFISFEPSDRWLLSLALGLYSESLTSSPIPEHAQGHALRFAWGRDVLKMAGCRIAAGGAWTIRRGRGIESGRNVGSTSRSVLVSLALSV